MNNDVRPLNTEFLAKRFKQLGLKQWLVAEEMRVCRRTVLRWVNGHVRYAHEANIKKLAKVLGCEISELVICPDSVTYERIRQLIKRGPRIGDILLKLEADSNYRDLDIAAPRLLSRANSEERTDILLCLARLKHLRNQIIDAASFYAQAWSSARGNPEQEVRILPLYAGVCAELGLKDEALFAFRQYQRIPRKKRRLIDQSDFAYMLSYMGKFEAAEAYLRSLRRSLTRSATPDLYTKLASRFVEASIKLSHDDPSRAADLYLRNVEEAKGYHRRLYLLSMFGLSDAYAWAGRRVEASHTYSQAKQRNKKFDLPVPKYVLEARSTEMLLRDGRLKESRRSLRAAESKPIGPVQQAYIYFYDARISRLLKRNAEADLFLKLATTTMKRLQIPLTPAMQNVL